MRPGARRDRASRAAPSPTPTARAACRGQALVYLARAPGPARRRQPGSCRPGTKCGPCRAQRCSGEQQETLVIRADSLTRMSNRGSLPASSETFGRASYRASVVAVAAVPALPSRPGRIALGRPGRASGAFSGPPTPHDRAALRAYRTALRAGSHLSRTAPPRRPASLPDFSLERNRSRDYL